MELQQQLDLTPIEDTVTNSTPTRSYLLTKRCKNSTQIDNTNLDPNGTTMLARSFRDAYYKQLESTFFSFNNKGETVSDITKRFYHIALLVEAFVNKEELQVRTRVTSRYKKDVVATLNYFIRKNYITLFTFYQYVINGINVELLKRQVREEDPLPEAKVVKQLPVIDDLDDIFG